MKPDGESLKQCLECCAYNFQHVQTTMDWPGHRGNLQIGKRDTGPLLKTQ